jgi:hypothetical protein
MQGILEMDVRADSQDDEQISENGDRVYGQEVAKDYGLQCWIICQFQEKEL